jgi:hypothetical protein
MLDFLRSAPVMNGVRVHGLTSRLRSELYTPTNGIGCVSGVRSEWGQSTRINMLDPLRPAPVMNSAPSKESLRPAKHPAANITGDRNSRNRTCGPLTHRATGANAPAAPEQDLPFPGVDDPLNPKP